jgi:hypothetical protein
VLAALREHQIVGADQVLELVLVEVLLGLELILRFAQMQKVDQAVQRMV